MILSRAACRAAAGAVALGMALACAACGDGGTALPAGTHQGMSTTPDVASIVHEDVRLEEASVGVIGSSKARPPTYSMIEPREAFLRWDALLFGLASQPIESLVVEVRFGDASTTIDVIPEGMMLEAGGNLEVAIALTPPADMSHGVRHEVLAARFADGSTWGDAALLPPPSGQAGSAEDPSGG
ncbi:MAG: hypothetical protein AAFX79_02280 [Planctomycetota bacterium]